MTIVIIREEILPHRESSKMKISRGRGREGELVQSQSDFHFATNSAWQKSFPGMEANGAGHREADRGRARGDRGREEGPLPPSIHARAHPGERKRPKRPRKRERKCLIYVLQWAVLLPAPATPVLM